MKTIVPLSATSPKAYNLYMPGTTIPATIRDINVPMNTTICKPISISAISKYTPAINNDASNAYIPTNFASLSCFIYFLFILFSPLNQNFISTGKKYKIVDIGIETTIIINPQNIRSLDNEVSLQSLYQNQQNMGQPIQPTEWMFFHSCPKFFAKCFHLQNSTDILSYSEYIIFYKNYILTEIIIYLGKIEYQKLQTGNLFLNFYFCSFLFSETSPNKIQIQATDVDVKTYIFQACFYTTIIESNNSFLSFRFNNLGKSISRAVFILHTVFMDLPYLLILSIIRLVFLYTLKQYYVCLKHANIPSKTGGIRRQKNLISPPFFFSVCIWECSNQLFIVVRFMSSAFHRLSPVSKEYFQSSYSRDYKVYSRFKISTKTLDDFGLKINNIDQGKLSLPKVWRPDSMSIKPQDENKKTDHKPFCCKHCGSENFIKYGKENNKQMYKCKDCKRKFVDNMFFERMKADPKIICLTLDLYFKGVSLRKISDHLKQFYDLDVYFTTVFRWIDYYIRIMDEYTRQFKPELGDLWNVDEMMVSVKGEWFYIWNVIDDETRFHLASVISKERKIADAQKTMITAKKRSYGKRPKYIITDGLKSYYKAIDNEFHTARRDTIHVGNVGIRGKDYYKDIFDNNLVERLQGTIRERNKIQRGLKDEYSSFIRGHQVYYNFIRPHQSLFNKTPAEMSGIDLSLGDNKWEGLLMQSIKNKRRDK